MSGDGSAGGQELSHLRAVADCDAELVKPGAAPLSSEESEIFKNGVKIVHIAARVSCARDGVAIPGHHRPDSWWTPQQGDTLHPDGTCSVAATAFSRRYQPGDNPNSPSAEYLCPAQLARAWPSHAHDKGKASGHCSCACTRSNNRGENCAWNGSGGGSSSVP
jgi:hypothetical protein